jgi:two-component sensor histidine kinase
MAPLSSQHHPLRRAVYLGDALSDRDVEELMRERGVWVDHTTVFRWVQRYASELDQRCRPRLKATNDSYRMDETYLKIKKHWSCLYRAVDSTGATLDFMLSATRDADAAERFFRQVSDMASFHLAPYVRRLGDALLRAYGGEEGRVTLTPHLEDLTLPLDSAVPCGLILHELLSNALKHAFPHGQAGAITLDLRAEPDQHVTLRVADTGVGVPEGFDVRQSDSLGLQLVGMLTEQLGGTLTVARDGGTAFTLTFPLPEAQAGGHARPVTAEHGAEPLVAADMPVDHAAPPKSATAA